MFAPYPCTHVTSECVINAYLLSSGIQLPTLYIYIRFMQTHSQGDDSFTEMRMQILRQTSELMGTKMMITILPTSTLLFIAQWNKAFELVSSLKVILFGDNFLI